MIAIKLLHDINIGAMFCGFEYGININKEVELDCYIDAVNGDVPHPVVLIEQNGNKLFIPISSILYYREIK